ncbi:MAG TPA: hypothetical protein VJP78_13890, partial [Thermoleophilia bacterium]|nr:hypothetical protein [Thermoleophilia bacterium]
MVGVAVGVRVRVAEGEAVAVGGGVGVGAAMRAQATPPPKPRAMRTRPSGIWRSNRRRMLPIVARNGGHARGGASPSRHASRPRVHPTLVGRGL